MPEVEASPGTRAARSRSKIVWRAVLLLVVLPLLIWHMAWRIGNARAVARLEAEVRQRGEPVTPQELAATYPPVPDADNAYVALERLWADEDPEFWKAFKEGQRPLPQPRQREYDPQLPYLGSGPKPTHDGALGEASVQAMAAYLGSQQDHLAAVRVAVGRKAFRAPIEFEDGFAAPLPYLSRLKGEGLRFQLEALQAIEQRQSDRALDAIVDIARVGHCLADDPLVLGQLVRIAHYSMAMASAERLLCQQALDERGLARLEAILSTLKPEAGLRRALLGERVIAMSMVEGSPRTLQALAEPAPGDSPAVSSKDVALGLRLYGTIGMRSADQRLMGETFAKVLACVENPDFATNRLVQDIFEDMQRKARRFPPRIMTSMLMPALQKVGDKFAGAEALRRCAETAIAVERYRQQHGGALPEALAEVHRELLPALPRDPFTGGPLHFKQLPDGFEIYSVGPDRRDNDGRLDPLKKGPLPREVDVGFRVERRSRG